MGVTRKQSTPNFPKNEHFLSPEKFKFVKLPALRKISKIHLISWCVKFHLISWCVKFQLISWCANHPKLCGNYAFPQSFHTKKLNEITVINAALF